MIASPSAQRSEFIVKLKRPHSKQAGFVNCKAKRIVLRAGRRGGKTTGVAIRAVNGFLAGHRVLYAAPTVDQVGRFWNEIKQSLADPIEAGVIYKNESSHTIEAPGTETRIKAKTAWNADSLRGDYADLLILDEWQLMNEDAWEQVGVPMLLDNNGDAIFIYTPPSMKSVSVTKAKDPRHAAKMFKKAQADKTGRWKTFHFSSHDNPHLSGKALEDIAQDMTALAYRQEIMAEDIDDVPGALWKMVWIERDRVIEYPPLERIVVAVDPSANRGEAGLAEAGIIVSGRGDNGHGYCLEDATIHGTPAVWAGESLAAYFIWKADCIVAEQNNGGEMVRHTIHSISDEELEKLQARKGRMDGPRWRNARGVPVRLVNATRGKYRRAEPISLQSEQGHIHHVGTFPKLEDELTMWVQGGDSPNRLDAYVWGFTDLLVGRGNAGISGGGEDENEIETAEHGEQRVDQAILDEMRRNRVHFPGD